MKTGILMVLLTFAVPSSQFRLDCVGKYIVCSVPVINDWQNLTDCSVSVPYIKCVRNVTEECDTNVTPFFKNLETLLEDVCFPDDATKEEWNRASECAVNNTKSFESCTEDLPQDSCEATNSAIQCTSSKMHENCGEFAGNVTDTFLYPIRLWVTECFALRERAQCLMNDTEVFRSCKVTGDFNTVGDICRSMDGYTQCLAKEYGKQCDPEVKIEVQKYIDIITFVLRQCYSITMIDTMPIPECDKEVMKCNANIFNAGDLKCTDLSSYLSCLVDAGRSCQEEQQEKTFRFIVLEKYKNKFPVYCDEESSFNKNMKKEGSCIEENEQKVVATCFQKLRKDWSEVTELETVGNLRAYVNFLHCTSSGFQEPCSGEAENAVNDLLQPLRDALDDSCRMLTGKRCNGACGLKVATWIFIAALTYLLTRRHE